MENTKLSVGFVDDTTIQLRLELGMIDHAAVTTRIPDDINLNDEGYAFDFDGNLVGRLRGAENQYFVPIDSFAPSAIADLFAWDEASGTRTAPVDDLSGWSLRVNGREVALSQISRKANVLETANTGWQVDYRTVQNVFLELDAPLSPGDDLEIRFDGAGFEPIEAEFAPRGTVSEAIHVNLFGYDPDDARKTAFLSSWNGFDVDASLERGGAGVPQEFAAGLDFEVIDEASGRVVLRGQTELAQAEEQGTNFSQNYALSDIWSMDLSGLGTAGRYHLVVDGVGRSQSFEIAEDHWQEIFDLSFSGYYHKRSGIALEARYTDWTRERALHPDDGIVVYETTVKITDTSEAFDGALPKPFDFWEGNLTGEILTDAWGGWHDAGDFDRRTQHLGASRKLVELHELQPEFSQSYSAAIPEAGNALPDILDEAIWGASVFRRLQHDDGGVPGGIESASYGSFGDSSFTDQRALYVYAPDAWTSWHYAATAAKIARALAPFDAAEAQAWLASAQGAFAWAQANAPSGGADFDQGFYARAQNLAAAELFEATGDAAYHALFEDTFVYARNGGIEWYEQQYEAAFVYARSTRTEADAALQQAAREALQERADWLLNPENGARSGFGFLHDPYAPYGWGTTATQATYSADFLLRMHALTGEDRYLDPVVSDLDYLLGANPLNMSFLTGADALVPGIRKPEEILDADTDVLGIDAPPGITLFGEYNIHDYGWQGFHSTTWDATWPNYYDAPVHESWQGAFSSVPITEFTVMQGMQDTTFTTGYLAAEARGSGSPLPDPDPLPDPFPDPDPLPEPDPIPEPVPAPGGTPSNGDDRIIGTPGADAIRALAGDDVVLGRGGDDDLRGNRGADRIEGGGGNDRILGNLGDDDLSGDSGNDTLDGNQNDDRLRGGSGNDRLNGHSGDDILDGGRGNDIAKGGGGADQFVYRDGDGRDKILGFELGRDALLLDAGLLGGGDLTAMLEAAGMLNRSGKKLVLDFNGGDSIELTSSNAITFDALAQDIVLI